MNPAKHEPHTDHSDANSAAEALRRGIPWLLFPWQLEQRYQADTAAERLKYLRITGWLSILLTQGFAFGDWWMVPDRFVAGAVIRFFLFLPAIAWWLFYMPRLTPTMRERGMWLLSWAVGLTQVAQVLTSHAPFAPAYLVGLTLIILVNGGMLRVRFWSALVIDLGLLCMYLAAVIALPEAPRALMVSIFITLSATCVFTLWGAYRMEHSARRVWLKSQVDAQLRAQLQSSIERFESMSRTDALTALPNRRHALRHMQQLWSRASHDGSSITVLLMDVDHFKRYNDRHGHPAGDACLRLVADTLRASLPGPQDLVARWGGEEFLVVLPGRTPEELRQLSQSLVTALAARQMPHGDSPTCPWVTLSMGACSAQPALTALSPDALVQHADEALYQAKQQGRNRCVWHDAPATPPQAPVVTAGALDSAADPIQDIERAISPALTQELSRLRGHLAWPHFNRHLEQCFWRDRHEERKDEILVTGVIALLVFNLFLPVDYLLANDVWEDALELRLAVFTPFWAVVLAAFWRFKRTWLSWVTPSLLELVVLASSVSAGACLSYVLASSHSPLVQYYHVGLMVVMLYGNLVQRLRFWFAALASTLIVAMHVHGALTAPEIAPDLIPPMILMLATCGIFSLMANYAIDINERRDYVMDLRSKAWLHALDAVESDVKHLSTIDPLTGLYNRRHADEQLETLMRKQATEPSGIAAIMIDVDHFKRFNDHHGHPEGDRCLRAVADALQSCVRGPTDFVARLGGEEFVAVLCPVTEEGAMRAAQRMRAAILDMAMPHGDSPTAPIVTVSMGLAWHAIPSDATPSALLAQSDEALYEAKRTGRNRVQPWRVSTPHPAAPQPFTGLPSTCASPSS